MQSTANKFEASEQQRDTKNNFEAGAVVHASDCAGHNEPALPAGTCDCGAVKAGG